MLRLLCLQCLDFFMIKSIWQKISRYEFSGYIAYALAGVFSALPPFVLMPTLTTQLSHEEFAKTALVWSTVLLITPFFGFGAINSASVRVFKLPEREFANHLVSIISLIAISGVIIVVAGLLLSTEAHEYVPFKLHEVIAIVIIAALFALGQLFGSLSVSLSRPYNYLGLYSIYGIITVVSVNLLIFVIGMGVNGLLLGLICGTAALALTALYSNANRLLGGEMSISESTSALTFGAPLMMHSVALNLTSTSDRFIIAGSLGMSQLALYSATSQVALLANFAAHAIVKGVQPRIFRILRDQGQEMISSLRRIAILYMSATLVLTFLIGALTPILVEIVAGPTYRLEWKVTFFLVLGGLFGSWYLFFSLLLHFKEKTILLSMVTISTSVLQVIVCTDLVSRYGLTGASIAYATSNGVMFSLTALLSLTSKPNDITGRLP